ncbi:hypothetical protein ACWIUD_00735 [Helicobacter sp. 23-1044]
MDCHDSASQNLAMTENDADSVNRRISHENAESKIKITHPLAPSAREGEQSADSANRTKIAESPADSALHKKDSQ